MNDDKSNQSSSAEDQTRDDELTGEDTRADEESPNASTTSSCSKTVPQGTTIEKTVEQHAADPPPQQTVDQEATAADAAAADATATDAAATDAAATDAAAASTASQETLIGPAGDSVVGQSQSGLTVKDNQGEQTRPHESVHTELPFPPDATTVEGAIPTHRDRGTARPVPKLPQRISRYETISALGEGTFGVVLKSRDPQLDRLVAVKLQKAGVIGGHSNVDRFLREARSAAHLRHPNIVPVFEYGEFADNQFIVYQFIEGRTLNQWTKNENPTLRDKIEIVAKIAEALDYAHRSGVIHRDIKPANILVDGNHEPHIADFGCARREQVDVMQTVDGSLMGTPAYMSPEAAAGRANLADGRSDIWSLGIILYEMLAGQRPFRGKLTDIFHAILHTPATALRQVAPDTPVELETITHKCIEKEVDDRFATCGDLAADLRRWLNGLPILSRRTPVLRRTWMWAKRNPTVASLLGAVGSMLLAVAIGSTWFSINLQNKQNQIVRGQLERLSSADASSLPEIVQTLSKLDPSVANQLKDSLTNQTASRPATARYQLAAYTLQKAKGKNEPKLLGELVEYFPDATPAELQAMISLVGDDLASTQERLWQMASDQNLSQTQRLKASCALAQIDPNASRWAPINPQLVGYMLDQDSTSLVHYCNLLKPKSNDLRQQLGEMVNGGGKPEVRERAAEILNQLAAGDIEFLISQAITAQPAELKWFRKPFADNPSRVQDQLDSRANLDLPLRQQTNVVLIKQMLGSGQALVNAFDDPQDSAANRNLRSQLIRDCGPAGVPADEMLRLLDGENPEHVLIAVIGALGQYDQRQIYFTRRQLIASRLLDLFENHPACGVHSTSQWLLGQWEMAGEVADARRRIQTEMPREGFSWHEDPMGICFAVFGPVDRYLLGPPLDDSQNERATNADWDSRFVQIPYRFGIATKETLASEFMRWEQHELARWEKFAEEDDTWLRRVEWLKRNQKNRTATAADRPMIDVTWRDAAAFCNTLTENSQIAAEQRVYNVRVGKMERQVQPFESALKKTGYRLPTSAEWEYACRSGGNQRFFFGTQPHLLAEYGWSVNNSGNQLMPPAQLKPNDFGLFDSHGNAQEWCHNVFLDPILFISFYLTRPSESQRSNYLREVRDQSYAEDAGDMTVFYRRKLLNVNAGDRLGFRLARTYQ